MTLPRNSEKVIRMALAIAIALVVSAPMHSQVLNNIANRAKQAANTKASITAGKAINKSLDKAEDAAKEGLKSAANSAKKARAAKGGTIYYVSEEGSNRNDGLSPESPFKNIQKAIDECAPGSTIYVAEGNYYGLLKSGTIHVTKPVFIYGGFNSDFSSRNLLKYRTMIQPSPESNGTMKQGTVMLEVKDEGSDILFDGLIFDRGYSVSYYSGQDEEKKAQPEGVESPRMNPIGTAGIGGADLTERTLTNETSILYLNGSRCDLTINNCAFLNAPNFCILGLFAGRIDVNNCIFVNQRMAALDIRGSDARKNTVINFTNNTVLFTWSRLADFGDMGYGFRFIPGTDCTVSNNIIGCSIFAGIDYTHVDSDKAREAARKTVVEDNIFFLNRKGDLTIPGGGNFIYVNSVDFDDVDYLDKASGNKTVKDASIFKDRIDDAYLKGFINANYEESTSYDPNSAVNTFRQAFGMNQVGTMTSKSSMFANRYRWEKALKLFGAMDGYGAQLPE